MNGPSSASTGLLSLIGATLSMVRKGGEATALISGLFLFLPMMALLLFLPPPALSGSEEELVKQITAYAQKASLPMIALTLPMAFGHAALLSLFLGTGRGTIGGHLAQGGRHFAGFLALYLLIRILVGLGMQLLLIPGLVAYMLTFLAKPAMLAESILNPFTALQRGFLITKGRVGALAGNLFIAIFMGLLAAITFLMLVSGFFALVTPVAVFGFVSVVLASLVITGLLVLETALSAVLYNGMARGA